MLMMPSDRYERGWYIVSQWDSTSKEIAAITLFVRELADAKQFYHDVFGLPVSYEDANSVVFQFEHTMINLLQVGSADELIAPATVAPANSGSQFVFTVSVDDVDAVCDELKSRGVRVLNGPMNRPWGIRTASFVDRDGYVWEIAH
jgi:catechol 2,3-dioxygenase-like lactoylglutathione lyase family enzyme